MKRILTFLLGCVVWGTCLGASFDDRYAVRSGDLNSDGRADLFLEHKPKIVPVLLDDLQIPVPLSRRELGDFVLQQNSTGGLVVTNLSAEQKNVARSWPQTGLTTVVGDFNLDGNQDLVVKGPSASLPSGQSVFVFAPNAEGALPTSAKMIDDQLKLFIKDVYGYLKNRTYFDSGLYYQDYSGYFRVAYFNCGGVQYAALAEDPNLSVCFSGCQYLGWEWRQATVRVLRFNPTGFSVPALNVLSVLQPYLDSSGVQMTVAEAQYVRDQLGLILGTTIGSATTTADAVLTQSTRGALGVLVEVLGTLIRHTGVIGGILWPSEIGDGTLTQAELDQLALELYNRAMAIARTRTIGYVSLYHGTDFASATALAAGAPLSVRAATENRNYPRSDLGFYLATDYVTAVDFALRAGGSQGGVVLLYVFTETAFQAVTVAGGKFRSLPGPMRYPGYEYYVPPRAFPVFDGLRASGQITVTILPPE
jgi:hypothetical protein